MQILIVNLISLVNTIYDHSSMFLSFFSDGGLFWTVGSGLTVAVMFGMAAASGITDGVLAAVRRWHGSIDDQLSNINNLVTALDRQHHEDFETQLQEIERQRQEIERLHAELNAR